jgi:PucR C-terminal helix-turn-helix domain/GGDEF-like domain
LDSGSVIGERLRLGRVELEQALLTRVRGIGNPIETGDLGYLEGSRTAVAAAVDYAIDTLSSAADEELPVPPIFLLQARLAARHEVRLDIVLRRYAAGHAILVGFLIEAADREGSIPPAELKDLLALSSTALDRLLLYIGEEYACEAARHSRNARERSRINRVERLLAGELVTSAHLEYPLNGWHVALVVEGAEALGALRQLARDVDRRLLAVEPRTDILWAWLGGRAPVDIAEAAKQLRLWPLEMKVGLGEPGRGVDGWRLSHRQALAVVPLAEGRPVALARYVEKGVLASIQKDHVLVESLRKLYLEPLSRENDAEGVLRETIGAYLAAECSTSSAASALKVHRQTVTSRLRTVEDRLGRSIAECALELSLARMLGSTRAGQ